MKIKKYIYLLFSVAVFTSCDMDMLPESGVITEDQKAEVLDQMAERLIGDVNALKSGLIRYGTISTTTTEYHTDFAFPAVCLMLDQGGQDMVAEDHGYNWFSSALMLQDRVKTNVYNTQIWRTMYYHMKIANDMIASIKDTYKDSEVPNLIKSYHAQALASRAFDYLILVQAYQFTYLGHENAKAVPIILDDMSSEPVTNNPRATVKEVYGRIMSDLNDAIELFEESGVRRASKAEINANVAYGLRARANLLMGNWDAAAKDAATARQGANPYSLNEVSIPSFVDANASSWIWGAIITNQDDVVKTGIVNWPSHMCALTGNGYTTATGTHAAHRRINSALWAQIPDTDIRKAWWVDSNYHSDLLVNAYGAGIAAALPGAASYAPYTNVKFGTVSGEYFDTDNSQDWPLMRAEEMIFIEAEAMARNGALPTAISLLESFVKGYRDTNYTCTATSLEDFIDEVWKQRRVELWGEGFALFDILRLKKPLIRIGGGFSGNCTFEDIAPESACLIYMIPESETNSNNGISDEDNNEPVVPPTPIG